MSFKDLFLLKIVRLNPEIRKEAIREDINVELLKRIIENDSDPEVCRVAQERILEFRPEVEVEHA